MSLGASSIVSVENSVRRDPKDGGETEIGEQLGLGDVGDLFENVGELLGDVGRCG